MFGVPYQSGGGRLQSIHSCAQDMPKHLQPKFILDVEMSELFIQGGLQDRVIQVSDL
jgi:hypothetical protein